MDRRKDIRLDQPHRRLARDFERYATTVAAFVRLAMIRLLPQTPRHESKLTGWALRLEKLAANR
jgi:hypothetical protein